MSACAVSALAALQPHMHSLANRVNSLPRRFAVSQATLAIEVQRLTGGLTTCDREAAFDCGVLASHVSKALEAAAEEVRVRAAQLAAYAVLLGDEEEEERGVAAVARALLSYSEEAVRPRLVAISWDNAPIWAAMEAGMRVRDGLDPLRCTMSGSGLTVYQPGDNQVTVHAVDGEGDVVESIEAEDVCVRPNVEGVSVTCACVGEPGVVETMYCLSEGCVEPVAVAVSVCGVVLPGSPGNVVHALRTSVILASVAPERLAAFLRELSGWLPRRAYTLLYRGSRDGMTAAAFHRLCDGMGPTLVLVQCDKGWVFGGHAGASWESYSVGRCVGSGDAFLLSVTGPYTSAPVRFPVKAAYASEALLSHECYGPVFSCGLRVKAAKASPTACFDQRGSWCQIGVWFEDSIGKGFASLTGNGRFLPAEVEVYAVSRT